MRVLFTGILFAAIALVSCGEETKTPTGGGVTESAAFTNVKSALAEGCSRLGGCHNSTDNAGGVVFSSESSYTNPQGTTVAKIKDRISLVPATGSVMPSGGWGSFATDTAGQQAALAYLNSL